MSANALQGESLHWNLVNVPSITLLKKADFLSQQLSVVVLAASGSSGSIGGFYSLPTSLW